MYVCFKGKMPLFEGIGIVGDKFPVVFDIGAAYTKYVHLCCLTSVSVSVTSVLSCRTSF